MADSIQLMEKQKEENRGFQEMDIRQREREAREE